MSSMEDFLRSSLDRYADRVQVSADAWATIEARIGAPHGNRARWRAPALIAASVVVVASAATIAVRAGAPEPPVAPPATTVATQPTQLSSRTSAVNSTPSAPRAAPVPSTPCTAADATETTRIPIITGTGTNLEARLSTDSTTRPGSSLLCIRVSGTGSDINDGVQSATPSGVLQYAHVTQVPGGSIIWGGATVIAQSIRLTDTNGVSTVLGPDRLTATSGGWVYFAFFERDDQTLTVEAAAVDSTGRTVGNAISLR